MARHIKRTFSDGPIIAVVMVSLTAILTYGLILPRLGFYYDDWYMIWSGHARGAASIVPLFSMDRPFMGVVYSLFYRLIGDSMLGWQIAALIFRIAGALAFYWIINMVWPRWKGLSTLAAMLFVVFPGFLAQPNAATKINHLIGYGAALFSIALTLYAEKAQNRVSRYTWTGLSLLLMALYLWFYEYMVGLELMRVVLLFWVRMRDRGLKVWPTIRRMVIDYIPYAAVVGLFLFWRVFIFESTRPATDLSGLVDAYKANMPAMVLRLIFQVMKDFFSATVFAWFSQPYALLAKAGSSEIIAALLMATGAVLLALGYRYITRQAGEAAQQSASAYDSPFILIATGALIALGAVFPVVLSNRSLDLMNAYKGYALHPSAGAIILLVGLVAMLRTHYRKEVLIALLALSVATQSLNGQTWAGMWSTQKDFWWQVYWRAPEIQDETLIMAVLPNTYAFQQDYEIWAPVNFIYRSYAQHYPLIQAEVLNQETAYFALTGKVSYPYVRDIYAPHDYRNLLVISQPSLGACVHVIDGQMPAYSTAERPVVELVGGISRVERIAPAKSTTTDIVPSVPTRFFGPEPDHGWCYVYQQAELARQQGDWQKIGDLYDQAQAEGWKANDPSEYFPFIEGLVNLGREEEARNIVNQEVTENEALRYSFCHSLEEAPVYPVEFGYKTEQIRQTICQ